MQPEFTIAGRPDMLEKLEKHLGDFSKGQRQIGSYILNNYDKAAFMTAGQLSRTVGVSESTVVRFACALGYEGYPKLQKHLQEIIKNKLTSVQRLNIMEGMSTDKLIDTVLKMEISNLKATRAELDTALLKKAIDYMVSARRIYILGSRSSAPLAQFLSYYLSYIFDSTQLITPASINVDTQLMHANENDVAIGIAFPRYAKQTVDSLKVLKDKGAKIVTITDNKFSPLYELGDVCVLTKSDMNSFVDSLVAPMSIINAIIIMAGLERKETLIQNFSEMETLWSSRQVYAERESDYDNDFSGDME